MNPASIDYHLFSRFYCPTAWALVHLTGEVRKKALATNHRPLPGADSLLPLNRVGTTTHLPSCSFRGRGEELGCKYLQPTRTTVQGLFALGQQNEHTHNITMSSCSVCLSHWSCSSFPSRHKCCTPFLPEKRDCSLAAYDEEEEEWGARIPFWNTLPHHIYLFFLITGNNVFGWWSGLLHHTQQPLS